MAEVGRPLSYKGQETIDKVNDYLDCCVDEEYQEIRSEGDRSTSYEHKLRVNIPTIEGLANFLEVHKDTLYEWEKKYKEFSDVMGKVRQEQAKRLINNGLSGDYNPTIAKVLLTKHGYREGTDVTSDNQPINKISIEIVNGTQTQIDETDSGQLSV